MSQIEQITFKLNVYRDNWNRFKERTPNYIERLEQFINDSGASVDDSMNGEELPEKIHLDLFGDNK